MEKESLIKLYTKQWQCCHSFTPEENHTCSMERCNIQHVIGGVWRRGNETHACIRSLCKNHQVGRIVAPFENNIATCICVVEQARPIGAMSSVNVL